MTRARYYPGADRTARWKGDGNAVMPTIDKLVLHSTETRVLPSYEGNWPTLTYDPWLHKWYQHVPIDGSATALVDPSGTAVRENRDNVCQVEIVGYCDPKMVEAYGHDVTALDQQAIGDLGAFVAWLHTEWGMPLRAVPTWLPYPRSYGDNGVRLTGPQYDAYTGVLGHQHVSGNSHGDPGDIDIAAIMAAADRIANPPPHEYPMLNLNCRWPGFRSTPKTPTWANRSKMLATAARTSGAQLLTVQELGRTEAAHFAAALGSHWHYQRAANKAGEGLNCVFWDDRAWKLAGTAKQLALSSFGQYQRTLLVVPLQHVETGQKVRACSTHLASGSDLTVPADNARRVQAAEVAKALSGATRVILGADLNSRESDSTGPRAVLTAAGWRTDAAQVPITDALRDRKGGIDAILTRPRVHLTSVRVVPLGTASDHDGRFATFTITD